MRGHRICFYDKNLDNYRKIIPVIPSEQNFILYKYLRPLAGSIFLSGALLLIHLRKYPISIDNYITGS